MNSKIIVLYDSKTENTKKISDLIASEIQCDIISIDDFNFNHDYDVVFIGTPVHGYRPTKKIKNILPNIKSKYCALFCTYGAPLWGKKSADGCLDFMENKLISECLGKFKCRGSHEFLRTYKEHPNENDFSDAKKFALDIKEKFDSFN